MFVKVETLKAWSYSRLSTYESCPHAARLMYMDKIKTEGNAQTQRGSSIHDQLDNYVTGKSSSKPELEHIEKFEIDELRETYKTGSVITEQKWAFDSTWQPVDFFSPTTWNRTILDVLVFSSYDTVRIIDYKTGGMYEPKHDDQGRQYCVAVSKKFPQVKNFIVEFWYVDQGTKRIRQYDRAKVESFTPTIEIRVDKMLSDYRFWPKPHQFKCPRCFVKNHCEYAEIEEDDD